MKTKSRKKSPVTRGARSAQKNNASVRNGNSRQRDGNRYEDEDNYYRAHNAYGQHGGNHYAARDDEGRFMSDRRDYDAYPSHSHAHSPSPSQDSRYHRGSSYAGQGRFMDENASYGSGRRDIRSGRGHLDAGQHYSGATDRGWNDRDAGGRFTSDDHSYAGRNYQGAGYDDAGETDQYYDRENESSFYGEPEFERRMQGREDRGWQGNPSRPMETGRYRTRY